MAYQSNRASELSPAAQPCKAVQVCHGERNHLPGALDALLQ